jgi:hypothetical protein
MCLEPLFYKNRERLPQRKQMTIALAVMAEDGMVVAADTQESTGALLKGNTHKMSSFAPEMWAIWRISRYRAHVLLRALVIPATSNY